MISQITFGEVISIQPCRSEVDLGVERSRARTGRVPVPQSQNRSFQGVKPFFPSPHPTLLSFDALFPSL